MKKLAILAGVILILFMACQKETDQAFDSETGTGGSMARFTIKGNYLYAVDQHSLHTFNISQPHAIEYQQKQHMGFGIETIFPAEDFLFMGARNGMHIYGLDNPSRPQKVSFTPHFVAYDPVVVEGNFAYVTLRGGENNSWIPNLLMIFDISIPETPQLVAEHPMDGPRGLSIDEELLFLCDDDLLKIFRITNGIDLELTETFSINAIDVIARNQRLYIVARDGFHQYTYKDGTIKLLSKITLNPGN